MTIDAETQEEITRLDHAVDDFASEMKARLREQARKGYRGWDDPENYQRIVEMMVKHAAVAQGEEVDVANLAMILWSLRRRGDRGLG
jgi:DNA relaxase NicK